MTEQTATDIKTESTNRTAWMVERNSTLWGHEWFCAGENRWTKDPNKTIQFPDKGSAEEVWRRLLDEESKEFPYSEEGADWVYTISITEHAWIDRAATLLTENADLKARLEDAERVMKVAKEEIRYIRKAGHFRPDCIAISKLEAYLAKEKGGK